VAIGLDRSHEGRVAEVRVRWTPEVVTVEVVPAADADVSLELYAADARKGLLAEVLDREVVLRST
jgi:hypothetical protein